MNNQLEMNDIIADFNNDKNISSYSMSSDDELELSSNTEDNSTSLGKTRDDEFLFYNNENSNSDCHNDSSSDIDSSTIEKSFFTSTELSSRKDDIIKLFYMFDVVIFTDDYRINIVSKSNCYWWLSSKSKKLINTDEFPGILFLSFNSVNLVKKIISKHNTVLLNSDSESCHNKYKYQICFDEGDIYKNMVYKKIQIQNKLLFVPMSKYQLKLTEYRLRGFCQIMEELGAIEIEIEFNHGKLEGKNKNIEIKSSDYTYIAGTLGFSASNKESENEGITYKLIYPKHNTFILNSKVINKKITTGKYIISKKNFDSNLELQYIIDSRCRHFITNYSTVFTLDNSVSYDYKLMSKLEASNFNLGFETSNEVIKNLKLSINTKVKFCDQKDSYANLLGDNVSWDSIGFNYLLGTLREETFKEEGIFKLIFFIHKYIDKVIYKKNKEYYYIIKKIYKTINKEFSFTDYRDLLLSHFTITSHWLHLLNFIDILVFKSVSYDKLGFLILMSQTDLPPFKKHQKIINFIRHVSTQESSEDQFWEMLEPNNYYLAINKLDNEYDILEKFNWFNLKKLIYDLKKYKPNNSLDVNNELSYRDLYQNFILGHNISQFEKNIKPYLIKFINNNFTERIKQIEPQLSGLIFEVIKSRQIVYYNINTEEKLKDLVETKMSQIEEGFVFFTDIYDLVQDHNRDEIADPSSNLYKKLVPMIQSHTFKNKYPYIYRKLTYILINFDDIYKLVNFCSKSSMFNNMKSFCLSIVRKALLYDYKFNINNIELNKLGFNILLLHIKNTSETTPELLKVKFFIKLANFIIKEKTLRLNDNILQQVDLDEEITKSIINCHDFDTIVDITCNHLNSKYNLNIETEFYRLMKN